MASIPRFYVYILARPSGEPFYVGKGHGRRILDHEAEARSGHKCHKCNVIRKIWREGGTVQRRIVFVTNNEDEAFEYEIELIAFLGRKTLCNQTDGGQGRTGSKASEETRAKLRAVQQRIVAAEGERERRSEHIKQQWTNPEIRAVRLSGMQRSQTKEETRRNHREGLKRRWANSEERQQQSERIKQALQSPDVKKKLSEAVHARYAKTEEREKTQRGIKAVRSTLESRAKTSETNRQRYADPSAREKMSEALRLKWSDPEYRLRMQEAREKARQRRNKG
jgi:hypothetical protein